MSSSAFIGYIYGLEIKDGFSYKFYNGIRLLRLKDLGDELREEEYKQLDLRKIEKDYFTQDHEFNILIKDNVGKSEKLRVLEELHLMADLLSTFFEDHHSIDIMAATDYARRRLPHNTREDQIRLDISVQTLDQVDDFLQKLSQMPQTDKENLSYGLKYLNRSKNVRYDEDFPSNSHAIFFRVALESIFGSPGRSVRHKVSSRASQLFGQNYAQKHNVDKAIKTIYSQASKPVHGISVSKKQFNKRDQKQLIDGKPIYYFLVKAAHKIMNDGKYPYWNEPKTETWFYKRLRNILENDRWF